MAQYIILIIAYMIPVVWLSVKHTGNPIPQLGVRQVLEGDGAEKEFNDKATDRRCRRSWFAPSSASRRAPTPSSRG